MKSHQIREARPADRPTWLKLRYGLWPRCPQQKHELEMDQLLRSGGTVFVAEDEHAILIGFAEVSVRHDHVDGATISPVPYLEGWFVEGPFRNQGIGGALIGAVEQWARSRAFTELASDAVIDNVLSIRLHKKLGFSEIDRNVTFLKKL